MLDGHQIKIDLGGADADFYAHGGRQGAFFVDVGDHHARAGVREALGDG